MTEREEYMRLVLEEIWSNWRRVPDQRLGQLLANATSLANNELFFVEDNRLLASIGSVVRSAKIAPLQEPYGDYGEHDWYYDKDKPEHD